MKHLGQSVMAPIPVSAKSFQEGELDKHKLTWCLSLFLWDLRTFISVQLRDISVIFSLSRSVICCRTQAWLAGWNTKSRPDRRRNEVHNILIIHLEYISTVSVFVKLIFCVCLVVSSFQDWRHYGFVQIKAEFRWNTIFPRHTTLLTPSHGRQLCEKFSVYVFFIFDS